MLSRYLSSDGVQNLILPSYGIFPGGNIFTVIVGKNGTGKSRMLRNITLNFLQDVMSTDSFEREDRARIMAAERFSVEAYARPSKIICVSASPFDRFPMLRRSEWIREYSYLGLRGLSTNNLSLSYMSRIMAALINSISRDRSRMKAIENILEYLGYEPLIRASFFLGINRRLLEEMFSSNDPAGVLRDGFLRPGAFPISNDVSASFKLYQEASDYDIKHAMHVLLQFFDRRIKPRIDVELTNNNMEISSDLHEEDVMVLLRCGLLRLKDIELKKRRSHGAFRIGDASSGEQSVVMSLLGIGSQIENGALICIDEPEVCLHPEWQEKYIHLLISTFENYHDCHFLIATHSPQIVAELPGSNCFVTNMETKEIYSGNAVRQKSIDYQLASIFETPGFGNEYLNRVALNTFLKVGKQRAIEGQDKENFSLLERMESKLDEEDPLKDLIVAIREMFTIYG